VDIRVRSASVCLLVGIAGFVVVSRADERTEAVHFAKGRTATTLKNSIRGDASVAYELGASMGQTLSVAFKPSNASCYFNVLPPAGDTAIFIGSTSGNEFSAKLGSSGTYRVPVYLMRNAARRNEICKYSITFEISGNAAATAATTPAAAAPASVTRGNMPAFCRGEASRQYGVKPAYIETDAITAGADGGSSIDGTADKGPDGIKKFRCRFDAAGRFIDVMAMTSDGE
jgi:hypothetical protein